MLGYAAALAAIDREQFAFLDFEATVLVHLPLVKAVAAHRLALGLVGAVFRRLGAEQAHAAQRVIMAYEGARAFADLQARHRAQLSAPLNQLIDEGAAIDDARYRAAQELRRATSSGRTAVPRKGRTRSGPPSFVGWWRDR